MGRSIRRRVEQCEAGSLLSHARGQAGGRWELSPWQSIVNRRGGAQQPGIPAGPSHLCLLNHSMYMLVWATVATLKQGLNLVLKELQVQEER